MEELTARLDALEASIEGTEGACGRIAEVLEGRIETRRREIDALRMELGDFRDEMNAEIDKLRSEARQAASRRW